MLEVPFQLVAIQWLSFVVYTQVFLFVFYGPTPEDKGDRFLCIRGHWALYCPCEGIQGHKQLFVMLLAVSSFRHPLTGHEMFSVLFTGNQMT
ncbi:hypothetical protein XELAEV_18036791mg [Xenopus laevis]|uniref:Uncharacterized protein n=1 Tax=Xenopus laevis TaxID=8355 RepID=A0A974CBC2_XENLA|nr:hypothetical protein XELAEV_18036791mg [Xenopus laevis]